MTLFEMCCMWLKICCGSNLPMRISLSNNKRRPHTNNKFKSSSRYVMTDMLFKGFRYMQRMILYLLKYQKIRRISMRRNILWADLCVLTFWWKQYAYIESKKVKLLKSRLISNWRLKLFCLKYLQSFKRSFYYTHLNDKYFFVYIMSILCTFEAN